MRRERITFLIISGSYNSPDKSNFGTAAIPLMGTQYPPFVIKKLGMSSFSRHIESFVVEGKEDNFFPR